MEIEERRRLRSVERSAARVVFDAGGRIPDGAFVSLGEFPAEVRDVLTSGRHVSVDDVLAPYGPSMLARARTGVAQLNGALSVWGNLGLRASIANEHLSPFGGLQTNGTKQPRVIAPILDLNSTSVSVAAQLGAAQGQAMYTAVQGKALSFVAEDPTEARQTFLRMIELSALRSAKPTNAVLQCPDTVGGGMLAELAVGSLAQICPPSGALCGLIAGAIAEKTVGESPSVRARVMVNSDAFLQWLINMPDRVTGYAARSLALPPGSVAPPPPLGTPWRAEWVDLRGSGSKRRLVLAPGVEDGLGRDSKHPPLRQMSDEIWATTHNRTVARAGCPASIALPAPTARQGAVVPIENSAMWATTTLLFARVTQVSEHTGVFDDQAPTVGQEGRWLVPHGPEALAEVERLARPSRTAGWST